MIVGFNKKIGCEPPEQKGLETKVKNGFAITQHKSNLMGLKVVFGSPEIPEGSTIYLSEQAKQLVWANQIFELEGKKFILVPEGEVLLVDYSNELWNDPKRQ